MWETIKHGVWESIKQNAIVCYLAAVVLALLTVGVVQAQPVKHVGHAPQLALTDVVKSDDVAAPPGGTRFDDVVYVRHAGHAGQLAAAIYVGHAAQLSHARGRG